MMLCVNYHESSEQRGWQYGNVRQDVEKQRKIRGKTGYRQGPGERSIRLSRFGMWSDNPHVLIYSVNTVNIGVAQRC
jgi:hypothetical protein